MNDFDRIKALLAVRCPHLTQAELDDLTCDLLMAISMGAACE
jgi:hypothetical protein